MKKIVTGIALITSVVGNVYADTVTDFSFTGTFSGDDAV